MMRTTTTTRQRRAALLTRTALCGALVSLLVHAQATALPSFSSLTGIPQVSAGGAQPTIMSTTGETNITLHAARTVLDWAFYDVAGGQSVKYAFDARNWIVLNRIADARTTTIAGTIEGRVNGAYGGNIWFAAKNGMIFNAGAQVDAGGILISTASPELTGFLNPNTLTFSFPGSDVINEPRIGMAAGSSITGHGGLVALIAPTIVTAAAARVSGQNGSSVLYGAAKGYQLRLQPNAPGDFDLVDFVIPSTDLGSASSVALDLQNTTNANSVFVAVVSRSSATNAVINLEGMITAQAATADGGDIVLSGGGGIVGRAAGPQVGGTDADFYLRQASASRDIRLQTSGQVLGSIWPRPPALAAGADIRQVSSLNAGRDIGLAATKAIGLGVATAGRNLVVAARSFQANSLMASGALTLNSQGGDITLGSLSLGGTGLVKSTGNAMIDSVSLSGGGGQTLKVDAATDVILGAGAGSASGGNITLLAGRNVAVDLSSATFETVTAGQVANLKAGTLNVGTVKAQQILARGGNVTIGQATSAGDVYVASSNGSAKVTSATAGDDVYVLASGGSATLTSAVLTAAAGDTVGVGFAGNPDTAGNGRVVAVQSSDADAFLGLGTGSVSGASKVSVQAGQDALVDLPTALPGTLSVIAQRDATLRAPTVNFDTVQAGRDINLTATAGDLSSNRPLVATRNISIGASRTLTLADVTASAGSITLIGASITAGALSTGQDLSLKALSGGIKLTSFTVDRDLSAQGNAISLGQQLAPIGRDLSITSPGDLSTNQPLVAARNVSIGAPGALTLSDVTANAGSITLTGASVDAGALNAGQDLTLKAVNGGVKLTSFRAGRDLSAQGNSLSLGQQLAPIGRDFSVTSPGDFVSASDLTAGRNVTLTLGGAATLQGVAAPGMLDIVARDLTLSGTVTAANIRIQSATGALRVGGSSADGAPASGLWLDNAEFGRLHATGQINLFAGALGGTPRGDLTILNLDVNPQSAPQVNFLAATGKNALVEGVVAPTVSGGVIHIGDGANADWKPTSILVSGALGTATYAGGAYTNVRSFSDLRLFAAQDIIVGSPRFISLILSTANADIDIGRNRPAGVVPTAAERNRVMAAADTLEFSAAGKVLSQNTAPIPGQSVGLFLTGQGTSKLILDPPVLVDLYGAFISQSGAVVSGFSAGNGLSISIVDSFGNPTTRPLGAIYRFNSCAVDTTQCSGAAAVTANLQQNIPVLAAPSGRAIGAELSGGSSSSSSGGSGDPSEGPASGPDQGGGSSADNGSRASGGGKAASRTVADRNAPPPLLAVAPAEANALLADPVVTGAGSEEIWRKRKDAEQGTKP